MKHKTRSRHNKHNRQSKCKKAELSFKQVMFMFAKFVMLIIIMFLIVYTTKKYIIVTSDITDLESEIMLRSLMTNKGSVIFYDEAIDRAYPFLIDIDKFKLHYSETLANTFDYGKPQRVFAARLRLFDIKGENYKGADTMYINKDRYNEWERLAKARFFGPGSAAEKTKKYYVNIIDNGCIERGVVEISIVMPNT